MQISVAEYVIVVDVELYPQSGLYGLSFYQQNNGCNNVTLHSVPTMFTLSQCLMADRGHLLDDGIDHPIDPHFVNKLRLRTPDNIKQNKQKRNSRWLRVLFLAPESRQSVQPLSSTSRSVVNLFLICLSSCFTRGN